MSDGRQHIVHTRDCSGAFYRLLPNRVVCTSCTRYASRTDVPPGVCEDCKGACRPDAGRCSPCFKTDRASAKERTAAATNAIANAIAPERAPIQPTTIARLVCRACYQPVTVRLRPGRGFVCSCAAASGEGKAA